MTARRAVVTGAFSYSGAAIAAELQRRGWIVHSLTNRPRPAGKESISTAPLRFEPGPLQRELEGADVLVNTYWIRFPHAGQTFESAVARSRILFEAAGSAGVPRIVHLSVSNADPASRLDYYRGKAEVEAALRDCGTSHAILRPTLVVGEGDVLVNNIAWLLRRCPFFLLPGTGEYRLQPVTLADLGRLAADAVEDAATTQADVAGPEVMTFRELVGAIAAACGVRRPIVSAPVPLVLAALRTISLLVGDVVLTRQELDGLVEERLISRELPRGTQSVREWLHQNGSLLGRAYVNDIRRHFLGDQIRRGL